MDDRLDASGRLAAANRLLATLRAGRTRVNGLAQQHLDFKALVRLQMLGLAEDPADAVNMTLDIVDRQISLWREVRSAATAASAGDAAAHESARKAAPSLVASPPVAPVEPVPVEVAPVEVEPVEVEPVEEEPEETPPAPQAAADDDPDDLELDASHDDNDEDDDGDYADNLEATAAAAAVALAGVAAAGAASAASPSESETEADRHIGVAEEDPSDLDEDELDESLLSLEEELYETSPRHSSAGSVDDSPAQPPASLANTDDDTVVPDHPDEAEPPLPHLRVLDDALADHLSSGLVSFDAGTSSPEEDEYDPWADRRAAIEEDGVIEAESEGIEAIEAESEGIGAIEAESEGIGAIEAESEGIGAIEAHSEGFDAIEAESEGVSIGADGLGPGDDADDDDDAQDSIGADGTDDAHGQVEEDPDDFLQEEDPDDFLYEEEEATPQAAISGPSMEEASDEDSYDAPAEVDLLASSPDEESLDDDHTVEDRPHHDDELDTLSDYNLTAAQVHGSGAVDLLGDDPHGLSDPHAVQPRLGQADGGDDESAGDRIVLSADIDQDRTESHTGSVIPVGASLRESMTNELAVGSADEDFLGEDDDHDGGSAAIGMSVSFEVAESAEEEDDEDEVEEKRAPRLTDDAPMTQMGNFDPSLELQPVQEVDQARLAEFIDAAQESERRGDLHDAILRYSDAIDLAPDTIGAYLGRGRAHMELGDYAAAMSDFQRAEDLAPGDPGPLAEMGNLYFARKEYRRAVEFYDQALEIDATLAMARCRRGICHHYRRNHKLAFQDLQKAYSLDPDIPNIRKYVQMAVKAMERDRGSRN